MPQKLDHVLWTLTKPYYQTYSFELYGRNYRCFFNPCSIRNQEKLCGFLQPDTVKTKVTVDAVITDETAQERLDGLKYAKEILTSDTDLQKYVRVLQTTATRVESISSHKELTIKKENVVLVQIPPQGLDVTRTSDKNRSTCSVHVVRSNQTYHVESHKCLGAKCSEQNVPPVPLHLEQFLKTAEQKTSSQVVSGMSVIVFNGVCYISSVALRKRHGNLPTSEVSPLRHNERHQHGYDVRTTPSAPLMDSDEDEGSFQRMSSLEYPFPQQDIIPSAPPLDGILSESHPSTDFHLCDCVCVTDSDFHIDGELPDLPPPYESLYSPPPYSEH